MKKRWLLSIAGVMAIGAGLVIFLMLRNSQELPAAVNQKSIPAVPAETERPKLIIGDKNAPITIIEYGDYQCPICKRFFDQTEPELRQAYIDTGRVKLEFRIETHTGEESVYAGEAAYCANDQNKFSQYHRALYERQSSPDSGIFSYANLKIIAGQLRLDTAKFNNCLDDAKYSQAVADSHAEASEKISGTPTFFIGEQTIVGAQPFAVFKVVIESQ